MSDTNTTTIEETETRTMPLWRVLIHNDDVNTADHVVMALIQVFNFEMKKCFLIMVEAHESGVALCKIEPKEHAELHQEQLQAFSLTATIEPE